MSHLCCQFLQYPKWFETFLVPSISDKGYLTYNWKYQWQKVHMYAKWHYKMIKVFFFETKTNFRRPGGGGGATLHRLNRKTTFLEPMNTRLHLQCQVLRHVFPFFLLEPCVFLESWYPRTYSQFCHVWYDHSSNSCWVPIWNIPNEENNWVFIAPQLCVVPAHPTSSTSWSNLSYCVSSTPGNSSGIKTWLKLT